MPLQFDSLVQTLSGFNMAEAEAYAQYVKAQGGDVTGLPPYRAMPMQALDHAAGYLLAFGIASALCKTITVSPVVIYFGTLFIKPHQEGGSWKVHLSLWDTMRWVRSLGTLDPAVAFSPAHELPPRCSPLGDELTPLSMTVERTRSDGGDDDDEKMTCVRHTAILDGTPVREGKAPKGLDVHNAEWPSL